MKFGLFGSKTIINRTESVRDTICLSSLEDSERKSLQKWLKTEKWLNYSIRVGVLPIYYLLYKQKYFESKRVNGRMAALLVGNIGVIALGDYLASEWMWANCSGVVSRYHL